MDSHFCQRVVVEEDGNTTVRNEGGFGHGCPRPYPVSYRSIVPKKEECINLLVPVCLSSSHVAYGSIRMEPVFMILGQSAGTAAVLAIKVGIGGDMPTLSAAANFGVHVVALAQQGFCSIVAREEMLMKELRAKRIAYAFGSNAHYALLQSLASAGLREEDVRLIPLDVTEMPSALAEGAIDAFSAWEPTPTIALAKQDSYRRCCHGHDPGLYRRDRRGSRDFEAFSFRRCSVVAQHLRE